MSGPENYRKSERLLADVAQTDDQYGEDAEYCRQQLAAAQVHATLALAAATALACQESLYDLSDDAEEWASVTTHSTDDAS